MPANLYHGGKQIRQYGAPPASLAKVYTTIVRPVLEYAAPVWQNIPDFLSYKIESIQKRPMRNIFPLMSYNEALNALNLKVTDAPIYARFILIDSGMRITPCILCSPNSRRLCILIILDLALAAPRVLPVGPSPRKSLSRISIPSGLYNYIF